LTSVPRLARRLRGPRPDATATATIDGSEVKPTVQKGEDGMWRIEDGLLG
jgi:hypothetical protein